ncbi:putative methyl-accepting chemotaxis protein, partial [Vibrio parahaemolyticus V-223/04]
KQWTTMKQCFQHKKKCRSHRAAFKNSTLNFLLA